MLCGNTSDTGGVEDRTPALLRSDRAEEWEDDGEFEEDTELGYDPADDEDDEDWEAFEEEFDDVESHPRHRPPSDQE